VNRALSKAEGRSRGQPSKQVGRPPHRLARPLLDMPMAPISSP